MHSDDIAISVRNLTKTYRLFGHAGDRVKQFLSLGLKQYHRNFTALEDVSFDIRRGETVGIIGRNGSGKSTLLQLVCGILKPTSGTVKVNGRIAALLELGAGFNPEFTGRENVYFQGALMGFTKQQMGERFDDIAVFAEIGEFIDQPVRTYSSGMFVRLAFAVAINVDPDVLVVDEAIAVGDAGFRARCFRRIVEMRNGGCTILFVSHAMDQILRLCDRSILLDAGELVFDGASVLSIQGFNQLAGTAESALPAARARVRDTLVRGGMLGQESAGRISGGISAADSLLEDLQAEHLVAYPPNGAVIRPAGILTMDGRQVNLLRPGVRYRCAYRIDFLAAAHQVRCGGLIRTRSGLDLGGAWSAILPQDCIQAVAAGDAADVEFEFECRLHPGDYQISLSVFARDGRLEYALHGLIGAIAFRVEEISDDRSALHVDFSCRTIIRMQEAGDV